MGTDSIEVNLDDLDDKVMRQAGRKVESDLEGLCCSGNGCIKNSPVPYSNPGAIGSRRMTPER
jgi:hypothetical protein